MSVGRLCVRDVDVAEPNETVQVAAQRMHSRNVGTLVVLDPACMPIGLVTDRDLTTRVLAEGRDGNLVTVDEVMTQDIRAVDEDCPIEAALEAMRAGPFRRVPVVNKKGETPSAKIGKCDAMERWDGDHPALARLYALRTG